MSNFTRPKVIKENKGGYSYCDIADEMLKNREVHFVGEVSDESVNDLILELMYLERMDADAMITMYINSPGGSVDSGMALYDVMKSISCPVRTVCMGMAASMSAVIFASGNEREMLPHSRIMIHDPLVYKTGGSALSLKSISEDLMETREIIASVLAEHTGRTMEEIYECTAKDTYFRAKEAIEFGLCDRVISNLKNKGEKNNE